MPLVNRPAQSYGFAYSDTMDDPAGVARIAEHAHPGGLVIAGRTNFNHPVFHQVSDGGGCMLIYLDAIIDGGFGRYHNYLLGFDHDFNTNPAWGAAVPRWPGNWQANEWGHLNDFRPGSIVQGKLEGVLEMMVAENPHMGGFFMDDVGSRSWFRDINWDTFGLADPTYQDDYRLGAIAICQTVRRVCDKYGLIFIVNGTWGAWNNPAITVQQAGGGYPDVTQFGISIADGGFVEHHPSDQLPYFIAYSSGTQWASESAVTHGVSFMLSSQLLASEVDAWRASNAFAYVNCQPSSSYPGYGYPPSPYSPLYPTGLPNRVRPYGYTELEWSLKVQAPAATSDVYQFRVLAGDERLDNYLLIPQVTIGTASSYYVEQRTINVVATVKVNDWKTVGHGGAPIVLNEALALYAGTTSAVRAYVGVTQVWP